MAAKQLLFNDEARRQLLSGVEQLSAAVKAPSAPAAATSSSTRNSAPR